jgi:hypothetical protein
MSQTARVRQWISALDQTTAPRSVNWWLRARFTAQLRADDRSLPTETRRDWAGVALLLTQCAEQFAGYHRCSALADTFNLRGHLIRELGPVPDDEAWDLSVLIQDVLAALTLQSDQARKLATKWPNLSIDQIRLLRFHKNVLAALVHLEDRLPDGPDAERVRVWLAVRPSLP